MGQVSSLSSAVSRTRKLGHKQFNEWDIIKKHENLDCPLQTQKNTRPIPVKRNGALRNE
jgi:hypothetical protein